MTGVIPGHLADDWLEHATIESLECRTLRHQWPRTPRPGGKHRRKLANDAATTWKILGVVEAGRLIERHMTCVGGCGTERIETFLVLRDGRMVRDGLPRYRYSRPYLRKRDDPDMPLEPLGQDQILGMIVRRVYPGLRW